MATAGSSRASASDDVTLARKLGRFDTTLLVMGGIVGSGIFLTPSVVASRIHDARLILPAWIFGGAITLIGAFIFAELTSRRPASGGLYGYLRDAYGPVVAFTYGWTALLVAQSGGIAAAAITFGSYVAPFLPGNVSARDTAIVVILSFTVINCFGVRPGSNAASMLMILKIAAFAAFVAIGFAIVPHVARAYPERGFAASPAVAAAFGTALIPIFFAYSGFQMAAFMDREVTGSKRTLPLALVWGVGGVIALYVTINAVCLRVLGAPGLAATSTPISDVMRFAFGITAQRIVACAIALSLLGFISNQLLASPRIYYALAKDRAFFRRLAWLHPKTRVPIFAIGLQGIVSIVIALSGRYDQILNYVTSISSLYLALAGGAVIVFRRRDPAGSGTGARVPGHPVSTVIFIAVSLAVVASTCLAYPRDSLIGFCLLAIAVPAYFALQRWEG